MEEKDPVKRMEKHLLESGLLTAKQFAQIREKYRKEVETAFQFAQGNEYAPPKRFLRMFMQKG